MAEMSSKKARKHRRAGVVNGSRVAEQSPKTVTEAAAALGLSVHTIRAWVATRKIAYLRLGRAIRIPVSEIQRLIDASTVPVQRRKGAA